MFNLFRKQIKKTSIFKIYVLENVKDKFLIKRYDKLSSFVDYLVCLNYDFNSNTYSDGVHLFDFVVAYDCFNTLVLEGKIPKRTKELGDCK